MDKEAAISLWAVLERQTYSFVNDDADADEWVDDNTPPTEILPMYEVRLDGYIDNVSEREYRLFVRLSELMPADDVPGALIKIAEEAVEAGAEPMLENNGVSLR